MQPSLFFEQRIRHSSPLPLPLEISATKGGGLSLLSCLLIGEDFLPFCHELLT